ncbi:hypothetical protein THMIRHAM_20450 [Thiomicrorhabdus immobilis]|uniref:DUF2607 family protein n=2 Tax=Thiomicrorhabdus immobilis TaxID=2791037 RepID=A0ABN6D2A2_9GAMM|nr:hypothetical protein THMIRHAM_20450 [Thiomicrorhabdus immobilis]
MGVLVLLFVLSQMAGLLHAEIHPFHQHEASCDVFENLAQPLDQPIAFSTAVEKPAPFIPSGIQLRSVFEAVYQPHVFGRAPPASDY